MHQIQNEWRQCSNQHAELWIWICDRIYLKTADTHTHTVCHTRDIQGTHTHTQCVTQGTHMVHTRAHNLCHDNRQLIVLAINCNHSARTNNCNLSGLIGFSTKSQLIKNIYQIKLKICQNI